MSFRSRRRKRKEADKAYERAAGVRHSDPTAERYAGGNTYSRADIEALEREKLPLVEAPAVTEYYVFVSLLCTAGDPVVMVWTVEDGEFKIFALRPLSWIDA